MLGGILILTNQTTFKGDTMTNTQNQINHTSFLKDVKARKASNEAARKEEAQIKRDVASLSNERKAVVAKQKEEAVKFLASLV